MTGVTLRSAARDDEERGSGHSEVPGRRLAFCASGGSRALPLSRQRPRRARNRTRGRGLVRDACKGLLISAVRGNVCSLHREEHRDLRHFLGSGANFIAEPRRRPETPVSYEPMFGYKQTLTTRLTDAVDLMIDFATLGEYGLEPVGRTPPSCESRHRRPTPPPCEGPRRRGGDRLFDRVCSHYDF